MIYGGVIQSARGDRTTCGGRVLEGSALAHRGGINFKRQAVQGNKVTCGVHAGRYEIVGEILLI